MACDLSRGRIEPCKDSVGGINAVYFINFGDANLDVTFDAADTDVIDQLGSTASDVSAYKYDLKGASSYEETITSSRDTGTTFFEQTLSLTLKGLTKEDHKEIKLLAYGRPHVIIEDYNGNLLYMGREHGADVTGGTVASGTAMGDLSGYTLTLTAQERTPANFCIPSSGTTVAEKLTNLNVATVSGS